MIEMDTRPHMDPQEWEGIVRACGGHPLHLPDVHEVDYAESDRMHLLFLHGSRPVGCALAYRLAAGRFRKKPRTLLLPAPPALCAEAVADLEDVYRRILELARGLGHDELVIQPHWDTHLNTLSLLSSHVNEVVIEFVLDVSRDREAIDANVHRVHRKNVRRAERDGVTVELNRSLDGLLALRDMQQVSSARSAERGGGFSVRDRSFFERLHDRLYSRGRGELLLAIHNQKAVAGLAYLIGAGRAMTVRSGSTQEGYDLRAMYLLQSHVIDRVRERGILELNLGGVPEGAEEEGHPQHGLYDFKRGWGGTEQRSSGIRMAVSS